MKRVILIRHAKSSWKDESLDDFERPLNKRGKRDAPIMAEDLKSKKYKVKKILSSSAKRAKKTAKIFSKVLDVDVEFSDALYLSWIDDYITQINKNLQKYDTLAVVGHNPELTELSNHLSDQYIENIPTSGYVVLECEANSVTQNSCRLVDFAYPKKLLEQM